MMGWNKINQRMKNEGMNYFFCFKTIRKTSNRIKNKAIPARKIRIESALKSLV